MTLLCFLRKKAKLYIENLFSKSYDTRSNRKLILIARILIYALQNVVNKCFYTKNRVHPEKYKIKISNFEFVVFCVHCEVQLRQLYMNFS